LARAEPPARGLLRSRDCAVLPHLHQDSARPSHMTRTFHAAYDAHLAYNTRQTQRRSPAGVAFNGRRGTARRDRLTPRLAWWTISDRWFPLLCWFTPGPEPAARRDTEVGGGAKGA
jgi:hypothetical protein